MANRGPLDAATDATGKTTDELILIAGLTTFSLRKDIRDILIDTDLTGDMFFNPDMGAVWDAGRKLAGESRIITPELLKQHVERKYHALIDRTGAQTVRLVEVERGVQIVRDSHRMRQLVIALKRATEVIQTAEYDDALAFLHEQLTHLDEVDTSEHAASSGDALMAMWERIDAPPDERIKPFGTGILALDEKLNGGLRRGQMMIIGGRPNDGKSVLAMQIAGYAAVEEELNVAVFSTEMSTNEVIKRVVASVGHVNYGQLVREDLDEHNRGLAEEATARIAASGLTVFDPPAISLAFVKQQCRALKRGKGLDLVIIDYVQMMEPESGSDSREQQVAKLSVGMKRLARELDCGVIVAAQLNRGSGFEGDDARPTLKHLRESDRLGQDPDMVLMLHHPKNKEGDIEVLIPKNRNGSRGLVTRTNKFHEARIV